MFRIHPRLYGSTTRESHGLSRDARVPDLPSTEGWQHLAACLWACVRCFFHCVPHIDETFVVPRAPARVKFAKATRPLALLFIYVPKVSARHYTAEQERHSLSSVFERITNVVVLGRWRGRRRTARHQGEGRKQVSGGPPAGMASECSRRLSGVARHTLGSCILGGLITSL